MLICLQLKIQYNSNKLAKLWNKLCERPCVRRGDRFPAAARRKCPFRRHASLAPRHRRINTAGLKIILFFPIVPPMPIASAGRWPHARQRRSSTRPIVATAILESTEQTMLVGNLCYFVGTRLGPAAAAAAAGSLTSLLSSHCGHRCCHKGATLP